MHQGQLVFSQLMRHLPLTTFRRCLGRYAGEHKVKSFSCLDQYLCVAFAQLTYRESLRDIESSGVRLGADIARDMIAVRMAPDLRTSVVSPLYFERHRPL
jgi:hypothetical protein